MELAAAKLIGAGLACSRCSVSASASATSSRLLSVALAIRRPHRAVHEPLIGFALVEATGLFGLLIALIILFG